MTRTPPAARRERSEQIKLEFKRKEQRRQTAIYAASAMTVAVLITLAILGVQNLSQNKEVATNLNLEAASGQGAESAPPWDLPADTPAQVEAAGLNLGQMGTADHYHAHLDILVDGQPVPVLANIGVDPSGAMSGLHTHTPDGVIHIEASTKGQTFTLGQLFTQWNVRLSASQIGSLTADNGNTLTAFVDGKKVAGDPAMIRIASRQQIALVYGPKDAKVEVPSTFKFDDGL